MPWAQGGRGSQGQPGSVEGMTDRANRNQIEPAGTLVAVLPLTPVEIGRELVGG